MFKVTVSLLSATLLFVTLSLADRIEYRQVDSDGNVNIYGYDSDLPAKNAAAKRQAEDALSHGYTQIADAREDSYKHPITCPKCGRKLEVYEDGDVYTDWCGSESINHHLYFCPIKYACECGYSQKDVWTGRYPKERCACEACDAVLKKYKQEHGIDSDRNNSSYWY